MRLLCSLEQCLAPSGSQALLVVMAGLVGRHWAGPAALSPLLAQASRAHGCRLCTGSLTPVLHLALTVPSSQSHREPLGLDK